ncbi:MAG: GGDEF domain-containing protein [Lachnospiraceae bacterium]|nr:GGDEF domain-containing protein [Lachnospiraceae bacterium]
MRKRIGVFVNGWDQEIVFEVLKGIKNSGMERPDVFVFETYTSYGTGENVEAENTIYELPNISAFDGIIVFASSIADNYIAYELCQKAQMAGVPVVTFGKIVKNVPCIRTDNKSGMYELLNHLTEVHNVKHPVFIAGKKDQIDSNERIRITKEVFLDHGIRFEDEDVYYGNWEYIGVKRAIDQILKDRENLPDAFICANDAMALYAITLLNEAGYKIPENTIVTGYDNASYAKSTYPALTTVNQDFQEVGRRCVEVLFGNGQDIDLIESKLVIAESCGCKVENQYEEIRRKLCSQLFSKHKRDESLNYVRQALDNAIIPSSDFEQLKGSLEWHYENDIFFNCENMFIMIDDRLFENCTEDNRKVFTNSLRDTYKSLVAFRDGKNYKYGEVDRDEIIPGYKETEEAHVYFISPILAGGGFVGYVSFVDFPYWISDNLTNMYTTWLSQAFTRMRTSLSLRMLNRDLMELYRKDSLSGLYNRFTYDETIVPMFNKIDDDRKKAVVCFFDIDYMKKINDKYGHQHGDNAIRIVSSAIKENERPNSIGMRYGGDEFLVVSECKDREDAAGMVKAIHDSIEKSLLNNTFPFKLSVSIGYTVTDPYDGKGLEDYIKEADVQMYKVKDSQHRWFKP